MTGLGLTRRTLSPLSLSVHLTHVLKLSLTHGRRRIAVYCSFGSGFFLSILMGFLRCVSGIGSAPISLALTGVFWAVLGRSVFD